MFNKKILLIILAIVVLLVIGLYFFIQKKPSQTITAPDNAPNQQSETPVSPSTSQSTITVPAGTSDEDIQKAFANFASQESAEPLRWSKFNDSKNQPISLDEFANAVGINLKPQLKMILDVNDYELFACNDGGMANHGVFMNIRLLPDYNGNLYQDEVKFMRLWENSLFQDTAKIIFPNFNFTRDQLQQSITFKDGAYRYADVILPDNTSGSINYNLVDDYVIISSSKDCLEKASEYVFSTSD